VYSALQCDAFVFIKLAAHKMVAHIFDAVFYTIINSDTYDFFITMSVVGFIMGCCLLRDGGLQPNRVAEGTVFVCVKL
jgi:hypothetical protein